MQERLRIVTNEHRQVVNITTAVANNVPKDTDGVATVFIPHTTAALLILDVAPGMEDNLLSAIAELMPHGRWQHPHDDSYDHVSAHLLASLIGPSVTVPYMEGELELGTWQRIAFVELDGPRDRSVIINT